MMDLYLIVFNGPDKRIYMRSLNEVPTKNAKQQMRMPFAFVATLVYRHVDADGLSPSIFHCEELQYPFISA